MQISSEILEFLKIMSFNDTFMPQGDSYHWQSQLIGLHAFSDLLIALAYYSIPALFAHFACQQRDVVLNKGFLLLGAWFLCGGTTHLMDFLTLGHPNYWLSGFTKAVTGVISLFATAQLPPLIPKILALFTPEKIAAQNDTPSNFTASIETEKSTDRQIENPAQYEILNLDHSHLHPPKSIHSCDCLIPVFVSETTFETPEKEVIFVQDLQEQTKIETAGKKSEANLLAVQELSLDGFNILQSIRDSSGAIVDFEWEYVNPAAAKILQFTPEELIGKRVLEVLPSLKTSGVFDSYQQVVETGIPHDIEVYYNSEGFVGWFRNMTVKLGDGVAISFSDITDRKQVEASLRDALEKLTSHFENSPLAVIEWDENFRCSSWSPAAEKIFGWTEKEVVGLHFSEWKFIFDDDVETVKSTIANLQNQSERCNILHNRNYHKSGCILRCEWYNSAFYNESGHLVSLLSLVLDVTERFDFLEVLRQSEERFRIAAKSASDLIYEWDLDTGIVLWFGHIDQHLKYQRGGFPRTQEAWQNIVHPDDRDRVTLAIEDYLHTCKTSAAPFFQEYRVVTRVGEFLYWIDRGKIVLDNRGNPCKWIGVISDITDRKLAESERNLALAREQAARRQAEASEQLYSIIAEAIPQIVWTARPDGWLDYYNARWFEYTGLTLEQTQAWGWKPVLHPDDAENCLERWNTSVQTGATYEVEYRFLRASDQSYRWHLGRALPVRDASGKIIKWFGTCTDIDDRKREAQTAYFRAQALAVLSASLDGEQALQGLTDLAVPGLADWCCVHLVEADGSIRLQAVAHSDPTKISLLWQIEQRSPIDPDARHGVAKVLRSGESKVYAEIPDSVLEAVILDAELLDSLRAEGTLSIMCVPLIARGRTLGAISLLSADSSRRYARADLGLVEDWARDAAVAIDNARLYREAAEANRIKDEFLATLSHELRTPLNAILGWAQILQQRKLSPEKAAVALETIERNARLQTQMIEDLLDVSRIVSGKVCLKLHPVDLVRTIEAALNSVRPDAETRGIELASFYSEGVGLVSGDATRLQQVVWNLLSNALKFTPPSGRVEVRLSSNANGTKQPLQTIAQAESKILSSRSIFELENLESPVSNQESSNSKIPIDYPKSPYIEITVSDTGIGISKQFLPFVFDRFRQADSTSTRSYGGLGLGLAIVRHLVELHGGTVWVESPGESQGATFGVRLPLY
jgi:PAS domain S-box-containing protein